jgi:three-Cys-motif partner protein
VLPDSAPEKWEYREHMRVKHTILQKYLAGWIRHLGSRGRLFYIDGFAGRGVYEAGEFGSPVIAMETAHRNEHLFSEFHCYAVERNKSNFESLRNVVADQKLESPKIKFHPLNGAFSDVVGDLPLISETTHPSPPGFFFLDPFGFGGIPFNITTQLLTHPTTEVLITFMSRDIIRFLESEKHAAAIHELLGEDIPSHVMQSQFNERQNWLVSEYRKLLSEKANVKFTMAYKVAQTERRQVIYHLIHASNHFKAFKLMKDIMFAQGAQGEFTYFGPDEGRFGKTQARLWEFDADGFVNWILERFRGQRKTFWQIMEESYSENPHIERQYRIALKAIRDEGRAQYQESKPHKRGGLDFEDAFVFS